MSVRAQTAQWQGFYYVASGLWALFDLDSFEWVTGPKTDDWLVRTMALLLISAGVSLIVAARRAPGPESRLLGIGFAASLFAVDGWCVSRDLISPVYLLDACVEAVVLIAWSFPKRSRFRVDILRRAAPHWRSQETK